jgi:hypothetical protein
MTAKKYIHRIPGRDQRADFLRAAMLYVTEPGLTNSHWERNMEPNTIPPATDSDLAGDTLEGAAAIARFLYRADSRRHIRKVYYSAERSRLPIFRFRSKLCVRKSVLVKYITDQEKRVLGDGFIGAKPQPIKASRTRAMFMRTGNACLGCSHSDQVGAAAQYVAIGH